MPTDKQAPLLIHKGNNNPKNETTFYLKYPSITDIIFATIDNQGGYLKILDVLMSTGHKKNFYVSVSWIMNTAHVSRVTYYAFRDTMKYIGWMDVQNDIITILYDEIYKGPVKLPTQKELEEIKRLWKQGVECSLATGGLKAAKERLKCSGSLQKDVICKESLQNANSTGSLQNQVESKESLQKTECLESLQNQANCKESLQEAECTESLPSSSVKWGEFIF